MSKVLPIVSSTLTFDCISLIENNRPYSESPAFEKILLNDAERSMVVQADALIGGVPKIVAREYSARDPEAIVIGIIGFEGTV